MPELGEWEVGSGEQILELICHLLEVREKSKRGQARVRRSSARFSPAPKLLWVRYLDE